VISPSTGTGHNTTVTECVEVSILTIFGDLALQEKTATGEVAAEFPGAFFSGIDGAIFNYSYTTSLTNCVVSSNRGKPPPVVFETLIAVVATPNSVAVKKCPFRQFNRWAR
jgi:hypothetical protein